MIIAELKKKENIVEYILYIRQLMDIMRANGMDMSKIDELLVSKFEVSEKEKLKIHNWYQNLIETMRNEGVTEHGDIKEIKDLIEVLNKIHHALLDDKDEYRHHELYNWAKPNIDEYKRLSKSQSDNEIEICINAMHALLLLKLQAKTFRKKPLRQCRPSVRCLQTWRTFIKKCTMDNE